jgi:hypothetical protein
MEVSMGQSVVEITEFSLLPGTSAEAFLATADDVNRELYGLKGFRNRHLLKSEDGWVEIIEWERNEDAQRAGELWPTLPGIAKAYCKMVDPDTLRVGYHAIAAVASGVAPTAAEMEF